MRAFAFLVLLAVSAVLLCQAPPRVTRASASSPDDWFYRQRAYPSGNIPEGALEKALRQKAALEAARPQSVQGAAAEAAATWGLLGPNGVNSPEGPVSGRVTAIAFDPRNPEHVYIAAAGGGVWRSTDAGTTWQSLGDNLLSLSSGALVFDERITALYYGTGDSSSNGYGAGVLRSSDSGATWQQLSAQFNLGATFRLALHPQDTRTLYVARSSGVWRSTDGGETWNRTLQGYATDLAVDVQDPRLQFAALGRLTGAAENGVYRSLDGGSNWTLIGSLPNGPGVGRISLAESTANPAVVYAVVTKSSDLSLEGVYRSDDFGGSWRRLVTAPADLFLNGDRHQGHFDNMIAIDPRSPDRVYLGGVELYRSTDGGASWTNISVRNGQRVIHEDQFAVAFKPGNPDTIYVGNDGGMYRSSDGGDTWVNLNRALPITQFNNLALNPGGTVFLGGTQDQGVIRLSAESSTWEQVLRGDGGAVMFDPTNPAILLAGKQRIQPMRSINGGATWSPISQGIVGSDRVAFYPPFVMEPSNPRQMLFGTHRVWRSGDAGDGWTTVGGELTSGYVTALAIAPGVARTYYAGTSDGQVYTTLDGGFNWQRGAGVPNRWITSLAVHPRNHQLAYFAASGFGSGHVFRTQDGGFNWQDVSGSLPDIPANAVVIDPRGPVYVATDVGVFRSEDGSGNWSSFSAGLPNSFVTTLALDTGSNTLAAGTYGRGAYFISLRPPQSGPGVLARGIVNAASGSSVVAPGALVSLYGSRLASDTAGNTTLPVATSLAGATVTVNGIPAPLFFVSPGQINFQFPFEISASSAVVTVTTAEGSTSVLVQVAPAAPGIFAGSIAHAGNRPVDAANPATPGEIITFFATGLGATTPAVATGAPAPSVTPALASLPVTVTIGGTQSVVLFAGLAPGFAGLCQVNLTVPFGVSGDVPVVLSAGGRSSNTVTIAVR